MRSILGKDVWVEEFKRCPVGYVVGAVLGIPMTWLVHRIGVPSLDQLPGPLTGLGYVLVFFLLSFLSAGLLAFGRWATGGLSLSTSAVPNLSRRARRESVEPFPAMRAPSPLRFVDKPKEFREAEWPIAEGPAIQAIVENSSERTIRAAEVRVIRAWKIQSPHTQPAFPSLPRSLMNASGDARAEIDPHCEAAYRLLKATWGGSLDHHENSVLLAPGSRGQILQLEPGKYKVCTKASGNDILPNEASYFVEVHEGSAGVSCRLCRPGELKVGSEALDEFNRLLGRAQSLMNESVESDYEWKAWERDYLAWTADVRALSASAFAAKETEEFLGIAGVFRGEGQAFNNDHRAHLNRLGQQRKWLAKRNSLLLSER